MKWGLSNKRKEGWIFCYLVLAEERKTNVLYVVLFSRGNSSRRFMKLIFVIARGVL